MQIFQILSILVGIGLSLIPSSALAFATKLQQHGSVSVSRGGVVVEQAADSEIAPVELEVGHTFNEARLDIDYVPEGTAMWGIHGQVWVSAIDDILDRSSRTTYDLDFVLQQQAEYSLRHLKQGAASTSFVLENSSGIQLALHEHQGNLVNGLLEPDQYHLSIDASAFLPAGSFGQDFSQVDFFLLLTPVPEPSTFLLASVVGLATGALKRRR